MDKYPEPDDDLVGQIAVMRFTLTTNPKQLEYLGDVIDCLDCPYAYDPRLADLPCPEVCPDGKSR